MQIEQIKKEQGERLDEIITYLKLTQLELAKEFGSSNNSRVNAYVRGVNFITNENMIKLVELCKRMKNKELNLNWLILGRGSMFIPDKKAILEEAKTNLTPFNEQGYWDEQGYWRRKIK